MRFQSDIVKKYNERTSSFLTLVSYIFIILVLQINLLICNTLDKIPEKTYESSFDNLTLEIYRSYKVDNGDNLLSLEKMEKLKEHETQSFSRYINDFRMTHSFTPLISNCRFYSDDKEIYINFIPVFPNSYVNDLCDFDDYEWFHVVGNESIKEYVSNNKIKMVLERTFNNQGTFDFININKELEIKYYHNEISKNNIPTLYFNVDKFNDFLSTYQLENISKIKGEYYSLFSLLKDDKDGTNLNSFSQLIGFNSLEDFYKLESLFNDTSINFSSYSYLQNKSLESTIFLVKMCCNFLFYLTMISIITICFLQTYITFLDRVKDVGYVLSLGMDLKDSYILFFYNQMKLFVKALLINLSIVMLMYLILSLAFPINFYITFSSLTKIYFLTGIYIGVLMFAISLCYYYVLINKKVNLMMRVE